LSTVTLGSRACSVRSSRLSKNWIKDDLQAFYCYESVARRVICVHCKARARLAMEAI